MLKDNIRNNYDNKNHFPDSNLENSNSNDEIPNNNKKIIMKFQIVIIIQYY